MRDRASRTPAASGAAAALHAARTSGGTERVAFELELTPEFVDAVAARVADMLGQHQGYDEEWLDVRGAASHLGVPKSRIYRRVSQGRIPHYKDGARTFFSRPELDEWRRSGGRL